MEIKVKIDKCLIKCNNKKSGKLHKEFVEIFFKGCINEIIEHWHFENNYLKTIEKKLFDNPFHYGELSFSPIIINSIRKLTPIILTEYKYYTSQEPKKPRYIDYYFLIKDDEYFMECKLLDLSKETTKLFF